MIAKWCGLAAGVALLGVYRETFARTQSGLPRSSSYTATEHIRASSHQTQTGPSPYGINDSGQIVRVRVRDNSGFVYSFVYADGVYTTLTPPASSGSTVGGATSINNIGQNSWLL